ncbi:MAG: SusC/RagA family TonB-linked outer membrane protein, partial [Tannerella sp.]|nr:SusC/RagA family TonB-linked outer membrane protein [Tannerella sp.]
MKKRSQNIRPNLGLVLSAAGMLVLSLPSAFATGATTPMKIPTVQQQRQGQQVSITVTDEAGSPLPGANVTFRVDGKTAGNVTDAEGKVSLQNVPGNATLTITYIGYERQEVVLNGRRNLRISLKPNSEQLSEVVVVGFGTLQKKQVTNAVSSIKGDDLMVGVGGADISTSLQGKISGLVMYNLGSTNASTTFQLRSTGSINASTAPLIVIDGFPDADIRSINSEDIKSIDVLKDASAGAIYGSRAANGVILITTKSGLNTGGKAKVTYVGEFSKKQNYNAPEMLSGREYAEHKVGTDYGGDVDWWKELTNTKNFSQTHNVTVMMGTETAQIYTNFFYEKQEGISFADSRQDYGGHISSHFNLFDGWFELRPDVSYRQAGRDNVLGSYGVYQQAMRNNPTRSPYDPNSQTGYNVWLNETLDYNVLADLMLNNYYGLDKWFTPKIDMKLNIKAVDGLSYDQIVGYDNRQWEYHWYSPSYTQDELQNSRKGSATLSFSKDERISTQGYFSYNHEFKGGHKVSATAGYDYYRYDSENFSMSNYNFSVDGIKYWNIGEGSYLSDGKAGMSSGKSVTEKNMAYFARANYSYKDKYSIQASIRREGSSKFPVKGRWGNFPSVSAAWNMQKESFMNNFDWLKELKLRASYGQV